MDRRLVVLLLAILVVLGAIVHQQGKRIEALEGATGHQPGQHQMMKLSGPGSDRRSGGGGCSGRHRRVHRVSAVGEPTKGASNPNSATAT